MKSEQEKELRLLVKQKNQATNQDVVDQTARDLDINYRTKEVQAMEAKRTFYLYTRSVIHAKHLHPQ